ncbi:MAG: SulP family inorganic anion transporter [Nitrospirae bacterium]|nr:SulP family inorganic anion transporter [Nitrospirota bacterium]
MAGGRKASSGRYSTTLLKGDLFGGVTAAVVALPLALAFGVASGLGPVAGLYGAIIVGFFAAVFGGTAVQVSGPTGPMTVVMAATVTQFAHNPALAFTAVFLGGLLQILFSRLRLGRYITYIPAPVISGFMSGVGCIIIILQVAPLFGHPNPDAGVYKTLVDLPGSVLSPHRGPLAVGLVTLLITIYWPQRLRRALPAPLVGLAAGAVLALLAFPAAPVIGPIPHALPVLRMPDLEFGYIPDVLRAAFTLALLGSIDSLLTSLIADSVTRSQHHSDRELMGQGIGNALAGLFGAVPGAGATMRTMVNIGAGGRTRVSGAVHAAVLLVLMLGLSPLVEHIPLAALAAILLRVGWEIIDWPFLRLLGRADKEEMFVALLVALLTIAVDLITAVGVGIIVANLISARALSAQQLAQLKMVSSDADIAPLSETERALLREANGSVLLLHLSGPFSFCSAKDMVRRLPVIGGTHHRALVVDLGDVTMVDSSAALAIREMLETFLERGAPVFVSGEGEAVARLARMEALKALPTGNRVATRAEAIRLAVAAVRDG